MTDRALQRNRIRFGKPGKAMNDQQSRDWRRWVEAEQAGEDDAADALFSGVFRASAGWICRPRSS